MPSKKNEQRGSEPQSYGSNRDWLEGTTGQTVDRTPEKSSRHDEEFYRDRRDSEHSAGSQGGVTPDHQRRDAQRSDTTRSEITGTGTTKVAADSDMRRSWFRERDYK